MKFFKVCLAVVSLFLLTGFDSVKFDTLVDYCVERGKPPEQCICRIELAKKRLGNKFLELAHLKVTRQDTAYSIALSSLLAHKPDALQQAADLKREVERECPDLD